MYSVVIPLYNKEKYISQSIRSVLEQSYPDFELIIIDDGSTDNSVLEAKKIQDERIRIVYQENSGVSAARNKGIKEAQYDYISFLDADDLWEKDYLETMASLITKYRDCSVYASNYQIMSNNSQYHLVVINGLPKLFVEGKLENYFEVAYQSDPILWSSAITVKKEAIESIGGFPIGINAGEDLLTWARLAARFDIAYTTQPKAIFCRWDTPEHNKPRIPDSHNRVGEELEKLFVEGNKDKINGLEEYIAYWHKIRTAIYLRLGQQQKAKEEFIKMSEFSEKNIKYFLYFLSVHLPLPLIKKPLKGINYIRQIKRNIAYNKAQ